ncbi:diguanylate cyclase [Undibacterium sp. LX40W]|uniref:diguanylate cyclase n=1 Tax=Undibacterium nitidum TaxID=2762298 RepID=A0A923KT80_9BURK|nr:MULTISPECIES: GGDEF domain-containing protein [Undibacterium]MBC3882001.1 diguanylate cyclase [Undibacterium nitidum]MBC3892003.1 diguanylate cyclase [Undibacterium sp. LX40W]
MQLDPRTILIIWATINVMFAGVLALVGKQSEEIRGAKQWAWGDLLIGLSFALSSQVTSPAPFHVVLFASVGIGTGFGLLYNGIEAFRGKRCSYWIPVVLSIAMFSNNFAFAFLESEPRLRILINFVFFAGIHIACARALFVKVEAPLRTAYWIAGLSFSLIAVLCVARIVSLLFFTVDTVKMFSNTGVNPYVFFFASMAQMSMSLAFMLLINTALANRLIALAATDALTGLMNRRSLDQEITRQLANEKRHGECMSLMMIDVDHFKQINDQHGHLAGDEVLRRLAHLMQSVVRTNDYIARYGGEEFCILLPGTNEAQALILAERLRRLFNELVIEWDGDIVRGSISIGVADTLHDAHEAHSILSAADLALYMAKHQGRNRVIAFSAYGKHDVSVITAKS